MDDPQTGLFSPQTRATAGAAPGAAAAPRQRLLVQHPPLVPAPLGCGWGRLLGTPRAAPIPAPPGLAPFPFWPWGKFNHRGKAPRIPPALHPSVPAGWQGGRDGCVKSPGGAGVRSPSPSSPPGMAAGCWQRGAGTHLLPGACSKRCHKDIRQPQQSGWARSSPTRSPSPRPQAPRPPRAPKQLRCEAVGMSPASLPSICSTGSDALHLKPSPSPRARGWGLRLLLGPFPTGGTEPPHSASGALEYGKRRGKAFSVRPETHPSGMGRGGGEGSPKS